MASKIPDITTNYERFVLQITKNLFVSFQLLKHGNVLELETIKKVTYWDVKNSFHQISGLQNESACNNVVKKKKNSFIFDL